MWSRLAIGCCLLAHLALGARHASSIFHCSESNPQSHVDIDQLMGMWYGVEIINHKSDDAATTTTVEEGCPVLYFSEDRTPVAYDGHDYRLGRGYNGPDLNVFGRNEEDMHTSQYTTQHPVYGSDYQQYRGNPSNGRPKVVDDATRLRRRDQLRRMRLLWDEQGVHTEYSIRYNASRPGVWITSGPQNGSALEAKFNAFAGTMQVLKAVGNHMVLSFCLQMPDQQLFTVLLSRVQNFSQSEIHGVHNMLHRYGYATTSVRRVCTYGGATVGGAVNYHLVIALVASCFVRRF